jgi:hypothetical protein
MACRKGDNQEHVLRFAVEPLLTMVREFNVFLYIETQLFERTRKCYADEADRIVELQEVGQDCIKQVAVWVRFISSFQLSVNHGA